MNTFTLERTVLAQHLDDLKHVNNVQYLYWVQEVAQAHWEALTYGRSDEFEIWVVRSHHIEYKQAAQLGDVLTLTTYVKKSSDFLSERIVEVSLKSNNRLLARCSTQWCYLNKDSGKLERIPQKVLELLD